MVRRELNDRWWVKRSLLSTEIPNSGSVGFLLLSQKLAERQLSWRRTQVVVFLCHLRKQPRNNVLRWGFVDLPFHSFAALEVSLSTENAEAATCGIAEDTRIEGIPEGGAGGCLPWTAVFSYLHVKAHIWQEAFSSEFPELSLLHFVCERFCTCQIFISQTASTFNICILQLQRMALWLWGVAVFHQEIPWFTYECNGMKQQKFLPLLQDLE